MPKKHKRNIELFIVDTFVAIKKIKHYTCSFTDEQEFRCSSLHWDATIREFEIIGEALNNLLEDENFNALSPQYFRKIVNFRNVISHGYFGIDEEEVWDIITVKLDLLRDDLQRITTENFSIEEALNFTIEEHMKLKETFIVKYLNNLLTLLK